MYDRGVGGGCQQDFRDKNFVKSMENTNTSNLIKQNHGLSEPVEISGEPRQVVAWEQWPWSLSVRQLGTTWVASIVDASRAQTRHAPEHGNDTLGTKPYCDLLIFALWVPSAKIRKWTRSRVSGQVPKSLKNHWAIAGAKFAWFFHELLVILYDAQWFHMVSYDTFWRGGSSAPRLPLN